MEELVDGSSQSGFMIMNELRFVPESRVSKSRSGSLKQSKGKDAAVLADIDEEEVVVAGNSCGGVDSVAKGSSVIPGPSASVSSCGRAN